MTIFKKPKAGKRVWSENLMPTDENTLLDPLNEDEGDDPPAQEALAGEGQEQKGSGLTFHRRNTKSGKPPYDQLEWVRRDAEITSDTGGSVFKQSNVEVPKSWSQTALNIVASKYFHGAVDSKKRESSVRQLVKRVAETITEWGRKDGYFRSEEDADVFRDELAHLLLTQKASFNSPVWFNCGIEEKPQCSACFINSIEDSMESILELSKTEGMLFKFGSGTGSNLSALRSSKEQLSTGGYASGPVSFMKGFDAFAGVIKSGGKTRRAAKMVILNIDHPDIEEFINCKMEEEEKAWALIDAGYDGSLNGEAYSSVFYQNANHSVRVSDDFMRAVEENGTWQTLEVRTGKPYKEYKAGELMRRIAEAAWVCGDPGMQYDTTINKWHTCKASGRINASNPCSEFMFLDDTACNLASLNLLNFLDKDKNFDVEAFRHAVDIMITAQEIIVDNAGYPRQQIARNSHLFRPLGLGYANLGALLMFNGLPYDSDAGRNFAAAVTSVLTGQAYLTSARIAAEKGPFQAYGENREQMLEVIHLHRKSVDLLDAESLPERLYNVAQVVWKQAEEIGSEHGYRNAQVTVLAPTGTIGLMMDCDTTGIEPDLALVKFKRLSGGGTIKLVNKTVPVALERLGYDPFQTSEIVEYIEREGTIEGAPHLKAEHLPVFDCAFKPKKGVRSIHYMGHIKMLASVQPFLSGAISKTVNMPNSVSPEEIEQAFIDAWKLGVKSIAVYRDGCKRIQPLSSKDGKAPRKAMESEAQSFKARRRRLPIERQAITHKFEVGGHEGYVTVGLYEDGSPGEIFLVMAKEGSTVSGLMDCFATAISIALQYGVPLKVLVNKFSHTRFEPSGWTKNKQIPHAKSVMDYLFRWLASKFLSKEEQEEIGIINYEALLEPQTEEAQPSSEYGENGGQSRLTFQNQEDAPSCHDCGEIMVRNGACYKCLNCGATQGCS
jgi:ribonucleoside-diphosphate reductase alpha chain